MTELAYQLYDGKKYAVNEICQILEISKPTLYAYLQRRNENSEKRPQKTFAGD
jgi:predicted transcriptional regulator YheO